MPSSRSTPSLFDVILGVPRVSTQAWRRLGWWRRALFTVRAATLPLTLLSCLFGGLMALPWTPAEGGRLVVVTSTLVVVHAAANLLNDQVNWMLGVHRDAAELRHRYGAHPLAEGLIHPVGHVVFLALTVAGALALGLLVTGMAGTPAWWMAGIGAVLAISYTWPLQRVGLGEVAVFLLWGPMMVGGVYWVVSGDWGAEILILSVLFGLGPAVAALGANADKRRGDERRGLRTLPVILGPAGGPRLVAAVALTQMLAVVSWAWSTGSWPYVLLLAALPALSKLVWICSRRRPGARPRGYAADVWPLWYSIAAFRFARAAGAAFAVAALLEGI